MPPPPDHAATLRETMTGHWMAAGRPSYRKLAQLTGAVSHTTIAQFFSGQRGAPSWDRTQAIATALGVTGPDLDELRSLWGDAEQQRPPRAPARPAGHPVSTGQQLACPACGTHLEFTIRAAGLRIEVRATGQA